MPATYYLDSAAFADGTTYSKLNPTNLYTDQISAASAIFTHGNVTNPYEGNTWANICGRTSQQVIAGFGNVISHSPLPIALPSGDCAYRTANRLNGTFRAGTWTVNLKTNVFSVNNIVIMSFSFQARIYKSQSPSGLNAKEITNGILNSASVNVSGTGLNSGNNSQTFTLTTPTSIPRTVFENEYLFVVLSIKNITYAPLTNNDNAAVQIHKGPSTTLVAPTFETNVLYSSGALCSPLSEPEMYIYIAPDGTVYPLDTGTDKFVLTDTGTGTPPIEYVTSTGPYQDGETLRSIKLKPRILQLVIHQKGDSRGGYWGLRSELMKNISPRKQTIDGDIDTGVLRRINSLGVKRDLNCLIQEGPKFEPRDLNSWQEHSFTETLRFLAFDPIYFDPSEKVYTFDPQGSQLIFAATFPIVFTTILQDVDFQYNGTWKCFPRFVITGPANFIYIQNVTTDDDIAIEYDLKAGETITITLEYGSKSVVKNDGTNLISSVLPDSELGTFHLTEANLGLNSLHVHMTGVAASSQIQMYYNDRYWGI